MARQVTNLDIRAVAWWLQRFGSGVFPGNELGKTVADPRVGFRVV